MGWALDNPAEHATLLPVLSGPEGHTAGTCGPENAAAWHPRQCPINARAFASYIQLAASWAGGHCIRRWCAPSQDGPFESPAGGGFLDSPIGPHSGFTSALMRLLKFLKSCTFAPWRCDRQDPGYIP